MQMMTHRTLKRRQPRSHQISTSKYQNIIISILFQRTLHVAAHIWHVVNDPKGKCIKSSSYLNNIFQLPLTQGHSHSKALNSIDRGKLGLICKTESNDHFVVRANREVWGILCHAGIKDFIMRCKGEDEQISKRIHILA